MATDWQIPPDHVFEALGRRMTDETLPRSERVETARAVISHVFPLIGRAAEVLRPHPFVQRLLEVCLREIVEEKPS